MVAVSQVKQAEQLAATVSRYFTGKKFMHLHRFFLALELQVLEFSSVYKNWDFWLNFHYRLGMNIYSNNLGYSFIVGNFDCSFSVANLRCYFNSSHSSPYFHSDHSKLHFNSALFILHSRLYFDVAHLGWYFDAAHRFD